ncbi:MAG TPA: (Fe-S)-binding protein [Gaiellales bacterium]|jgi:L-lactate dehydrogenase complex protein LldE|nr:(Fe-S)-binding protein [Gaiellales bacterium]
MRASLFITCFNDTLSPETGRATVDLLERLGHEVEFREAQTCCGQMHLNSGYRDEARDLARRFVKVFHDAEVIVTPSASCAGMVRESYPLLLGSDAGDVPGRVFELTELLYDRLGVSDTGASFAERVCYHPTCHSLRNLGLGDRPEQLLRTVHGLELLPLEDADQCCGFGGTFAVKNADVSAAMLADKLDRIEESGAQVVTAVDNSCLMHIQGGLRRRRSSVRAMHIAEILAR